MSGPKPFNEDSGRFPVLIDFEKEDAARAAVVSPPKCDCMSLAEHNDNVTSEVCRGLFLDGAQ